MENSPHSDPTTATPGATGVVVIGDSETARPYLRALANLSRARVIGLLDLSKANEAAADTTVHLRSTDPTAADRWEGVDAFIHCGPLASAPDSVAVVTASEKPVFVDSRGGRHRADARTVRARIEAGEIGRVVFARFAAGNLSDDASTTARSGGEQLGWQRRAHVLDMLGWWIGDDPDTVYAQRNQDYESITVRYADGATAVCDISSVGPSYREVVVVGTSAAMSLTWADHTSVLLPVNGTGPRYVDRSASLDAVLDAWLESVRTGTAAILEASEFSAVIALDEAIELSVTSGRVADVKASRDNGSHS